MSRLIRDADTGLIKKLRLTNARASYTYVISPRPEGSLQEGKYGSEFIITDEETKALIKEYTKEVAQQAIKGAWGKVPNNLVLPYRNGDEEKESEAGALILKTGSPKFQPAILIRDEKTGRARHITEEDKDDIYSGMYADADVTFKEWAVGGKFGVTAYLNAICKVAEGEPFAPVSSIEDSFSLDLGFDDDDDSFGSPYKDGVNDTSILSLDDLLDAEPVDNKQAPKKEVNSTPKKTATPEKTAAPQLTIDDLL